MSEVVQFPVEPRVGLVSASGRFIGFSIHFRSPEFPGSRAAYVVFDANGWREVKASSGGVMAERVSLRTAD